MKKIKNSIINDLEEIYSLALAHENYSVALKAKELLGKTQGLFSGQKKSMFSLSDLSDEELQELIQQIENELSLDPRSPIS